MTRRSVSFAADVVVNSGQGYDHERWLEDKKRWEARRDDVTHHVMTRDAPDVFGSNVRSVADPSHFERSRGAPPRRRATLPADRIRRKSWLQRFLDVLGR